MTAHRVGVNPGFLTRHRLRLATFDEAEGETLVAEIDKLPGVDAVWLDSNKHTLKVAYDASRHNIDEIITLLRQHGVSLKDSWWSRLKLGWQRQIDDNIAHNARHEPHCCNKPPR